MLHKGFLLTSLVKKLQGLKKERSGSAVISIYTPAKVPFRLKDEEAEIPELDLQHRIMAIYPEPLWQQADSTDTE